MPQIARQQAFNVLAHKATWTDLKPFWPGYEEKRFENGVCISEFRVDFVNGEKIAKVFTILTMVLTILTALVQQAVFIPVGTLGFSILLQGLKSNMAVTNFKKWLPLKVCYSTTQILA